MGELTLRQRLAGAATRTAARDELRRRILEIVNRKGSLDDYAIWSESAPDHLPWSLMIEEIKALDKDKKLRLEIVKPGHWVIHSLETQFSAPQPAAKDPGKPESSKPAKRSGRAAKRVKA